MNASRSEDLRHAALAVLAVRHPNAINLRALRRHLAIELGSPPEEAEVAAAAAFLAGLGYVLITPDPLGASSHYAATTPGVLAHERGFKT